MSELSKEHLLKMIERGRSDAEDAIRSHPEDTITLYEAGLLAFTEGQRHAAEPEHLAELGITFTEFKSLHLYLLAMAFLSAWFHRVGDKNRRDKAAQSAALLVAGIGLDPKATFSTLLHYESNWIRVINENHIAEGISWPSLS